MPLSLLCSTLVCRAADNAAPGDSSNASAGASDADDQFYEGEYSEPYYPMGGDDVDDAGAGGDGEEEDFQEYFVHQVTGFHGFNENQGGEGEEQNDEDEVAASNASSSSYEHSKDPVRAPYEEEDRFKAGWRKYPLFIIILGG